MKSITEGVAIIMESVTNDTVTIQIRKSVTYVAMRNIKQNESATSMIPTPIDLLSALLAFDFRRYF